jgi:hypothetical protein
MRDSLQVILITVALFLSGLLVGIWTQKVRPLPPPPFGPMSEFGGQSLPGFPGPAPALPPWMQTSPNLPRPGPEEIRRRMATLEPQFEAFRKNVDAIEQQFRSSFEAILNTDQKHKFEDIKNRIANLPDPLPGCGPIMGPVFVSMVIYRPLLEHFTEDLSLDDNQQKQLKDLLIDRRNKLITLVDETPPPSFKLEKVMPPPGAP